MTLPRKATLCAGGPDQLAFHLALPEARPMASASTVARRRTLTLTATSAGGGPLASLSTALIQTLGQPAASPDQRVEPSTGVPFPCSVGGRQLAGLG